MAALKRMVEFIHLLWGDSKELLLFMGGYRASVFEKGFMVLLARLMGKRVILLPRTGLLPSFVERSKIMRLFVTWVVRCSYRVVCQSLSWKSFFVQRIGYPEKYVIISNWIDLESYREVLEQQFKKPVKPAVTVLYLGWVIRDKGVFELLVALDLLRDMNIELWIAGDGQDLTDLQNQAADKGLSNVTFFGWVFKDKKMELLKKADIFVLPSYFEGLPNALLEAMASGIPVIASNVGGIPDLITSGKMAFWLYRGIPWCWPINCDSWPKAKC